MNALTRPAERSPSESCPGATLNVAHVTTRFARGVNRPRRAIGSAVRLTDASVVSEATPLPAARGDDRKGLTTA